MIAGRLAAAVFAVLLAGCSFTGDTFRASGLDHITAGRTTLEEAARDLGAPPVDVWQQGGGSVLARWAWRATVATDAVYLRQELWLRFGPDGTFERVEHSVNVPSMYHPRSADGADNGAAPSTVVPIPPPAIS